MSFAQLLLGLSAWLVLGCACVLWLNGLRWRALERIWNEHPLDCGCEACALVDERNAGWAR